MTIERPGLLLILGQALDCATLIAFWLLFGGLITRLGGSLSEAETNPLVVWTLSTLGLAGVVAIKVGIPVAVVAWPWHPERYARWPIVVPLRTGLMVVGGVSGLVGAAFNVVAILQVGSVVW